MKLKLREIVWEITNRCDNNCSYCGSKSSLIYSGPPDSMGDTKHRSPDAYEAIIEAIAKYPPEVLDVSGGDPLLVDAKIHSLLLEKLRGVTCNIIINPLSLRYKRNKLKIVNSYHHIGMSLNTEEEIHAYEDVADGIMAPVTFITNFSLLNLYLIDAIASIVKRRASKWQIQFTMSEDRSITVFDKSKALEMLNQGLGKHNLQHLVIADNANSCECSAGINSLGILYNGLVVPCLSMRTWCKELSAQVQGNLAKGDDLETLWMTGFKNSRFSDCSCCKHFCSKSVIKPTAFESVLTTPFTVEMAKPQQTTVMVYAVITDGNFIISNATSGEDIVPIYGVSF